MSAEQHDRSPWTRERVLDAMRGRLTVSCQAYPGEPLRDPRTTAQMARAVVAGGAAAVRVQGLDDVAAVVAAVDVPVVGLWKDGDGGVFITPTLRHAVAVADAGAHVVALDGTRRPRPDGLTLAETVARLRETGWDVPDAQGNFVWFAAGERTAEVAAAFEEAGLIVRPFPGDGIRVSIGEEESLDRVVEVAAATAPR